MSELEAIQEFFKKDIYATQTSGIHIVDIGENTTCEMPIDERHLNARGFVMGGAIFTLADFTLAVAAYSNHTTCVTVSSCIHYLNAAKCERLISKATPLKVGKNILYYKIDITDENLKPIASIECSGCRVD
jgi:acyl-CoA thioesterase